MINHDCGRMLISLGCMAAFILGVGRPLNAAEHVVIDLGTLGGFTSGAWAINNEGRIVGSSTLSDGSLHAFVWNHGMIDIEPLTGEVQSQAFDINDAGYVAAMSFDLGQIPTHGLLWRNAITTNLGNIAARAVNSSGVTVGQIIVTVPDEGKFERAAQWQSGMITQLGTLGGDYSNAFAINDAQDVVGVSLLPGNQSWHAVLYAAGSAFDLGTLGGANSEAFDVNAGRQVVGVSDTTTGGPHAFLFNINSTGQVIWRTDLGTLDGLSSYARSINENGVVVGTSGFRAFRWESGQMTDLNTLLPPDSGWVLEDARGINDRGWVVGQGLHNGEPRAFLLAPATAFIPAVSEWGVVLLALCFGVAGTLIMRQRVVLRCSHQSPATGLQVLSHWGRRSNWRVS